MLSLTPPRPAHGGVSSFSPRLKVKRLAYSLFCIGCASIPCILILWLPHVTQTAERTGVPEWACTAIPLIFSLILVGSGGWLLSKADNPHERWTHLAFAAADGLITTFMAMVVGAIILMGIVLAVFLANLH